MSLVPRLRFKEFSDAWVEKKLGDVGDIITGSTPNTSNGQFYGGHYMFVSPTDIQQNRYIRKTTKTLTKLGLDEGRVVEKNSVCFVCIGSTIGKVGQLNDIAITNQQINTIKTNKDNSDDFIFSLLESKRDSIKNQANTHAIPIINKSLFSNILFYFPFLSEQQKIASFLTSIDKKIDLLQKKENLLKKYKQGVLQKIFNQEIRFKQDDGSEFPDWVEKKLGDFLYYLSERNKKKEISLVLSISNKNGFVTQSEQFDGYKVASNDLSTYKIVKKNDYAYNPSRINVGSIARLFNFDVGIVSPMYVCFSIQEMNHIFFDNLLKTEKIKNYILQSCVGSVRQSLNFDDLCLFKTNIPTLEEQELIANFLTALDKKIDITTNQLEKTRQYKTALLQQLFI